MPTVTIEWEDEFDASDTYRVDDELADELVDLYLAQFGERL